jgi:F-type H+-transporting ATPase subunit a
MDRMKRFILSGWLVLAAMGLCAANAAPEPAAEAAIAGSHAAAPAAEAHGGHHGLPSAAPDIWDNIPISNSMVATWVVALAIIFFARMATAKMQAVPAGAQNFWEWLVESLYDFLEGIIGPDLVKRTFWFFATIFIFILFSNWCGLIPGVGTIGYGVQTPHGFVVERPWFRGVQADLNMTVGMAMIFFVLWTVWALQVNGVKGFFLHLFGPKGETSGILKLLMIVVFLLVGVLEVVSILFRPVSLSFRLYGNIFAGENMLESMANLVQEPAWLKFIGSWLIPIPFYFLEVLVGLVQALVFMLLTAVFTLLICTHDEESHKEASH